MANSALDGVEMDDDAIRTQQVLDQVSNMVKENPDGAAALVKRWLSRA
jgi:flagellar biosynthesis/type III secretory pathway M-ring protein FliF/YscJ